MSNTTVNDGGKLHGVGIGVVAANLQDIDDGDRLLLIGGLKRHVTIDSARRRCTV